MQLKLILVDSTGTTSTEYFPHTFKIALAKQAICHVNVPKDYGHKKNFTNQELECLGSSCDVMRY